MLKQKKLSVIIVSYNTSELTVGAVDSVLASKNIEVIVVDNNSLDDSAATLKKKFGSKITFIENKENVGFARANNQGVRRANGEYVILLNSDTIVDPETLEVLVNDLDTESTLGIIAASLRNCDGSYQPQGGALPTLFNVALWWLWPFPGVFPGVSPYQDPHEPKGNHVVSRGWVGGTALMTRKDLYQKLGGLDEGIFMYAEDIDLCIRVHDAGLGVAIDPRTRVVHFGMQSGSSSRARLGEIQGLLFLFKKYNPSWQVFLLRLVLLKGSLLRYLFFGILRGDKDARKLYIRTLVASLH